MLLIISIHVLQNLIIWYHIPVCLLALCRWIHIMPVSDSSSDIKYTRFSLRASSHAINSCYAQYFLVYFGGVCEFSSIFLCTSQLFQYYPPSNFYSPNTTLAAVISAFEAFSQGMFVLTFFLFRIVGWAKMTYMLISDGSYIFKNRLLQRYCPGSGWFLWYLLSMGVLLGALQVYWLEGIANKILEVMNKNEWLADVTPSNA